MNAEEKGTLIDELKSVLPSTPMFDITYVEDDSCDYRNSKIGGSFYWPDSSEAPNLMFLAQINLAELPENDIFPKHGMLQFFIGTDNSYGLFEENGSLVVYHEWIRDDGIEIWKQYKDSPVLKPCRMTFELTTEFMSCADYRFADYADESEIIEDEEAYNVFCGCGSKLLGYPFFTQYDPREGSNEQYDTLLFQMDSYKDIIMWGDVGVANFFIKKEDLEQMDFSDVFYTWDCC